MSHVLPTALPSRCRRGGARWAVLGLAASCPGWAEAHIKWFQAYDLMQPPRDLSAVLQLTPFAGIFALALGVMFAATLCDQVLSRHNQLVRRWMGGVDAWAGQHTYLFLRVLVALLFATLARDGRTLLTPELAASSPCVAEIQWVVAACALFRRSGAVAGVGILLLYGMAVEKYGVFHMFDYPAFIGAALYLMWMAADRSAHVKALAILRVSTALTLMVGATEKLGYPQWSFQLLQQYPVLTFGMTDLEFYMVGAALVEFALAYLLLFGRLSGKAGAGILFLLMASAILLFGWMDAVGHALFLAALVALTLNRNPVAERFEGLVQALARLLERVPAVVRAALGRTSAAPAAPGDGHADAGAGTAADAGAREFRRIVVHGLATTLLFAAMVLGFVQTYRAANLALTFCSTAVDGSHLHR